MTSSDTGVSLTTATAIALGAVKATDIAKQLFIDIGLGQIPKQPKALMASACAVAASLAFEDGMRRRVLTACASAGLASILHTADRLVRAHGDIDRNTFVQQMNIMGIRPPGRGR